MWPFSAAAPSLESAAAPSACPVDPSNRSNYLSNSTPPNSSSPPIDRNRLSADREISSIPRWLPGQGPLENSTTINLEEPPAACPARSAAVPSTSTSTAPNAELVKNENWVYPSPKSFFDSLERKDRNPSAPDMPVVVPIHNAVNERVWEQVLEWEREAGAGESSKLVNFVGRPKDLSPRARWKGLIG